jgi:hypothetical protein
MEKFFALGGSDFVLYGFFTVRIISGIGQLPSLGIRFRPTAPLYQRCVCFGILPLYLVWDIKQAAKSLSEKNAPSS